MKITNFKEYVKTTDDIEFLRQNLLQSIDTNNKFHRRLQMAENIANDLKFENERLEWSRNFWRNGHNQLQYIFDKLFTLPFPLRNILIVFYRKYLKEYNIKNK